MRSLLMVVLALLMNGVWGHAGVVPDFIAKQCGGNAIKFKLADHRGSWVLLDFLLPGNQEADKEHYAEFERNLDRLVYEQNLKPVFFKSDSEGDIAQWWIWLIR